ncbi:MAG: N-acetylmuramoyl-L-alanine amidase [Clostridia bacterium]|nr:N-acetylmuramoyl-L-alanine amidase [Clostridia bacterium]
MKRRKRGNPALKIALALAALMIGALIAALVIVSSKSTVNIITGQGKIITGEIKDKDNDTAYSYYESGGAALLTPYREHGLGVGMVGEVVVPYAECTSSKIENNLSDPLNSPLARGTVDRIVSVGGTQDNPIYYLESGVKVNGDYLRVTENGFLLPDNSLTYDTAETVNGGVKLKFHTDWVVPVQVTLAPQAYYTGYLERIYNVEAFTAEYMDITFARTHVLDGMPDISASDIVKKCEWIDGTDGGTLRLYLRQTGAFFGWSYTLDKNGRFEFVIKKDIRQDSTPTVILDAGHGGSDPGASNDAGTVIESAMTLDIAKQTADILSQKGIRVVMTRSEDTDVSLDSRIAITRKYAPDMFVSIHCDSAETASLFGTHTFYFKNYSAPLAASIQSHMAQVYGALYAADNAAAETADKGIKFFPFAVTRVEECPSVLVECGYLSNATDCEFINSAAGRLKIADAIAKGILEQLNVG